MKRRLTFLLASCLIATLAGCSRSAAGAGLGSTTPSATAVPPAAASTASAPTAQDLSSLDWSLVELPVNALEPALAPVVAADGTTTGLLCADPKDWAAAVPGGWVAFRDSQALVPDPGREPSRYVPHPGWWMNLAGPRFGQLADGRQAAAATMTCGPTDGNGANNLLLVFDALGGTPSRPHLIGIYQPSGTFGSDDVTITGGHIALTWRSPGPNDAHASPSVKQAGTIDPVDGRLVPSWPDADGLRATLWEEPTAAVPSASATGASPPPADSIDLAGVDWHSFTLPAAPLAAAFAQLGCGPSKSVLAAAFPDGQVPFRSQAPIKGVTQRRVIAAWVPDPAIHIRPGTPGKAGWLLAVSRPVIGTFGSGSQVAAFSLGCMAAFPADGWPETVVVADGTGGMPNPLGIYNGGQFVADIAIKNGKVVAVVGDASPWQGVLTVDKAAGRVNSSMQPDKGYLGQQPWTRVELWTRN